ncbi:MAG: hypothetical protein IPM81_07950 [Saprospirales bacterium]|nr:hypothetical protein [Saprospirales bacterium]
MKVTVVGSYKEELSHRNKEKAVILALPLTTDSLGTCHVGNSHTSQILR